MRHALLHKKAEFIDHFIDVYKHARKRRSFPHQAVGTLIGLLFPGSSPEGRGAFKTVHKVSSRGRDLVLKTSSRKNLRVDERAYKRLPANVRNRYVAKIYWRTKYCLLQKYGTEAPVPPARLAKLGAVARHHGLTDIRPANIRRVGHVFKIVDANISKRKRRR